MHNPVLIILNWNNPADTLACLRSVAALDYAAERLQVIVVDNGSTDDSAARIRAAYSDVTLIETGANLGYAGGNNVGIRYALAHGADVIAILNNDVVIESGFLEPLLDALRSRPDVGVVTPLVAEQTADGGRVWALGLTVNWRTAAVTRNHAGGPMDLWHPQPPIEVDVASGAAMLVKREVFERVGLMDEDFFLYFEEVDWSLKVRQAGYRILAVPLSVVWHKVSATLGTTSPVIDYYMLRNHLRLIGRHWSGGRRLYLQGRVVLRNLLAIAAFTVKPHDGRRIPNRDARLLALRDALLGRWGQMGPDVAKICHPTR
jgi:GT2 family glycosyltransferase